MPKFSIITICKNVEADIERTIESVLTQNYTDYEYIIVDGASTDNTCQIVKQHNKRVTKFISEPDTGIYDAMNKGIKLAVGEYLLFLNAGDNLLHENVLTIVAEQLAGCVVDVFFGHILVLDKQTGEAWIPAQSAYLNKLIVLTNQPMHQAAFIRRVAFAKVGLYDTKFQIAGDYDWFLKAFLLYRCTYQYYDFVCSVFVRGGLCNRSDEQTMSLNRRERDIVIGRYCGWGMHLIYRWNFLYKCLFCLNIYGRKVLKKVLKLSK
ncbi:glycosyl transferase GTA-type super family [Candidatus Termititenax aidoneus]|uniref:Glycosyl transferase GTA-type super family n=1 Tax=Termititenax aidoneus TaxID=2218524 RepID=A0A388TC85_TERA1|nr:glycosyl transferase GTA-type super family [Candidatus Termititenax aidoneus]